ncbi:MAG: peptidase [Desulfobacteraceae bacterium 4572_88]|nr:MAG: peptidase [Desulfobacteraceae bacterium 4572_88]
MHLLLPKKDKIWAVKVSGAWRITFRFENGDAYIADYLNDH